MQSFIQKSRAYFFLALFCSLANLVEAQSPVLLKDVNTSLDGAPTYVLTIGNTVFFSAIDPALGRELWKTDGTVAGTVLVKDIASGTSGSSPTEFCNLNGILFLLPMDPEAANFGKVMERQRGQSKWLTSIPTGLRVRLLECSLWETPFTSKQRMAKRAMNSGKATEHLGGLSW